ncbi:putative F-box domain-containing protein [Seiridium cardinale]
MAGETVNPSAAIVDKSNSCPLLDSLPIEVRHEIYSTLFHSTRLSHGRRHGGPWDMTVSYPSPLKRIVPPAHSLAILRTCRKIHEEVGDSWLRQITFNFEDKFTMLQKLTPLPQDVVSMIRYLRIRLDMVQYGPDCDVVSALQLVPGLRLDRLTVLSDNHRTFSETSQLLRLLNSGDGWKELSLVTRVSNYLVGIAGGDAETGSNDALRVTESRFLSTRLGTVKVYRATEPDGCVTVPGNQEPFDLRSQEASDMFQLRMTYSTARVLAPQKDVMLVARRGDGSDSYKQRQLVDGVNVMLSMGTSVHHITSWREVQDDPRFPTWLNAYLQDDCEIEIDSYTDVDEYVWPSQVRWLS